MLVFIDETGDHNLEKIDPQYALFALGALLIEEEEMLKLDEAVRCMKKEFFGDDQTFILHSSELKRPRHIESDPRNLPMENKERRAEFYAAFDERVVTAHQFKLISCFIRKTRMAEAYAFPSNPYYFAFENLLNRILRHGGDLNLIYAEKRGNELDAELLAEYERLSQVGPRFYSGDTLKARTALKLVAKKENVNGLQVIDLILASLARDSLGKTEKMKGNDPTPLLIKNKYATPPTFFPAKTRL